MPETSIPILDLSQEIEFLWDELNSSIQDVLRSGRFIMGEPVKQFEQQVADYLGVKHAISVNSGTDALVIALRALGIGEGDEVITTSFTFFASVECISMVGATPVFVDIDPESFNIDVEQIESAITERTRAIIPVHLFGQPVNMGKICELAKKYNLYILEDTAQAFGSEYDGQKVGSIGDMGAYSFFPTKNLGAYGDAGLITTNNDSFAELASILHLHGARKKYHNEMFGYNSRMDTIQAAILSVKLPHVADWNARRQAAAERYHALLADIPHVVCPLASIDNSTHVYHQYTVRITNGFRDKVRDELNAQGIGTMIYYPVPVHQLPVYQHMNVTLAQTEQVAGEVLSLPMWQYISPEQQEQVAEALRISLSKCI